MAFKWHTLEEILLFFILSHKIIEIILFDKSFIKRISYNNKRLEVFT